MTKELRRISTTGFTAPVVSVCSKMTPAVPPCRRSIGVPELPDDVAAPSRTLVSKDRHRAMPESPGTKQFCGRCSLRASARRDRWGWLSNPRSTACSLPISTPRTETCWQRGWRVCLACEHLTRAARSSLLSFTSRSSLTRNDVTTAEPVAGLFEVSRGLLLRCYYAATRSL